MLLIVVTINDPSFSRLYHREGPFNQCKDSSYSFQASFPCDLLFIYPGFFESFFMVSHQGFFSFFNCSSRHLSKLWSAKLYSKNKHGVQHMTYLRSSSILHLAFRSAILSTLSFEMVLCHCWQFHFVFHDS